VQILKNLLRRHGTGLKKQLVGLFVLAFWVAVFKKLVGLCGVMVWMLSKFVKSWV